MTCPNCQQETAPGAAFCGNCGAQLPDTPAVSEAVSTESTQPAEPQAESVPVAPPPPEATLTPSHNNGKATASLVFGLVGLVGWLIPLVGVVLGILALIFGTIALKSQKRKFAIIGTILAIPVLALSIFFWVRNAQGILKQRQDASNVLNDPNAKLSQKENITTPCYSTKIPSGLTVSQADDSCTFQATNSKIGEQVVVKVLGADTLTPENLAERAQADAESTVGLIEGGSITGQESTTFAGSPSYKVTLKATDGSAGVINYVYKQTSMGSLIVILRTQASGQNFGTESIEESWSW